MSDVSFPLVPLLFLVTAACAIAFGVWQYRRARKAQREHHTSATARAGKDAPPAPPGP